MLAIDKFSRKPIYEQIIDGIKWEILTGILKSRDKLPSIRELSVTLSINPNTIQKAFLELDRDGIIVSSQGRGCFVSDEAVTKIRQTMLPRVMEIQNIAEELSRAGIPEETVIQAVREAYKSEKGDKKQ